MTAPTRPSSLPTHLSAAPAIPSDDPPKIVLDKIRCEYRKSELKSISLEEELDFVMHCSRVVSEQRADLARRSLKYSDTTEHERTLEGGDETIDNYLKLAEKSKVLDGEITALKGKCSAARNDCNYLFARLKNFTSAQRNEAEVDFDYLQLLKDLDDDGAMDKGAAVEPWLDRARTGMTLGATVGALGAGIAFTTLFSATRGRLDLIAWSFTSFISVVFTCAMFESKKRSRGSAFGNMRGTDASQLRKLLLYPIVALVALPLVIGMILLVVAVALLQDASQIVPGSRIATRAAGALALGLMFILLVMGYFITIPWPPFSRKQPIVPVPRVEDVGHGEKHYPSHILPRDLKWTYLPGGSNFFTYRQYRRKQVQNETQM